MALPATRALRTRSSHVDQWSFRSEIGAQGTNFRRVISNGSSRGRGIRQWPHRVSCDPSMIRIEIPPILGYEYRFANHNRRIAYLVHHFHSPTNRGWAPDPRNVIVPRAPRPPFSHQAARFCGESRRRDPRSITGLDNFGIRSCRGLSISRRGVGV